MSLRSPKNLDEFQELIKSDKLVVVDFYAAWCGPCKVIAPKFEKLTGVYTDVIFAKIDADDVSDVSAEVCVRVVPTFMFYKNGEKVDEVLGAALPSIEATIKKHL